MAELKQGSRLARNITATEQRFIWHDRIPIGQITVLAGAPAKGKSTLGYRIAADADVTTIFVTTEEVDRSVWRPRVEAAEMDLMRAAHHREVKFSKDPKDLEYLAELVDRYDAGLVVVDPLTNHLRGASIHRDEQVREVFEPYLDWLDQSGVALLLQMHVLRSVNPKQHALLTVPAGVASVAKAVYLFGDDPTLGADENIRILACPDKFNFGPTPASLKFEYATRIISVRNEITKRRVDKDCGYWIFRGESPVSAKALLITLAPETKERKDDRASFELMTLLREGPLPVAEIKRVVAEWVPSMSWRTVERNKHDMVDIIEEFDDERDKRKKWWKLSDSAMSVFEEATEEDDEIVIEEIDIPDTLPEEWEEGDEAV